MIILVYAEQAYSNILFAKDGEIKGMIIDSFRCFFPKIERD